MAVLISVEEGEVQSLSPVVAEGFRIIQSKQTTAISLKQVDTDLATVL